MEDSKNIDSMADIEGLTRELDALREEKRKRHLSDFARETLRSRGIDSGFADFLIGEDERSTAKNIGDFEKYFTSALAKEMSRRLPGDAPKDFALPETRAQRRGVRKM